MVRLFTGKSSWSLSLATSSYACAMPTCRPTVFLSGKGTNSRGKTIFAKLSLNTDPEPAVSSGCPRNGKTHAKTGRRDADRMGDCRTTTEDNAAERRAAQSADLRESVAGGPNETSPSEVLGQAAPHTPSHKMSGSSGARAAVRLTLVAM